MVGGALARPCISYPDYFQKGSIWDRWPYLLPNLCSAILLVVGASFGALFFQETNPTISRPDPTLKVGNWILSLGSRLLPSSEPEDTQQRPTAQAEPSCLSPIIHPIEDSLKLSKKPGPAFNRQVILNIACYGILAL